MSIVVVGAPASGKSTVGRALAASQGLEFIDVDAQIEARAGKSISEMFVEDGEEYFRALERDVTIELLGHPAVVSLGGGAVMNAEIREELIGHDVIWLQVSITQATRRVGMNVIRPLLLGDVRANLEKLLTAREPLYREVATITIDTNQRKVAQIVAEIESRLP